MQYSCKSAGFSLVELILTIVILGTIAAIGIPKFFNQSTFDERYFFDDMLAASRFASKLAIATGCSVRLTVTATGYSMDQDSNCDFTSPNFSIAVQRPDDGDLFSNSDVPSSVSLSASTSVIIFRPDHQVVNSSGALLGTTTIQFVGDITRQITIYGNSGYAVAN